MIQILENLRVVKDEELAAAAKLTGTTYIKSQFPDKIKGIILDTRKIDLNNYPNLRVISRVGVGLDNIDLDECKRRGIKVYNTPCYELTDSVAEFTIMQILNFLRSKNDVLFNKTVGIIGRGRIGGRVFNILFEATIVRSLYFYDSNIDTFTLYCINKESILQYSDIICVHVSGSKEVIGEKEITLMEKKPIIVNMARAGCVNIAAILKGINENKISGYITDVDDIGAMADLFYDRSRFLITPHIASNTIIARAAMEEMALENLIKGLKE